MRFPPGPRGLPAIGCMSDFGRDPLGFMTQTAERHGPLNCYFLGPDRVYQVNDPALIGEVLLANHKSMHKDALYRHLETLLGKGLVTSEDELWKRQRKIAAKPFSKKAVDGYAFDMVRLTADWAAERADGEVRDIADDMASITRTIVLQCLFGGDSKADTVKAGKYIQVFLDLSADELFSLARILPGWIPTRNRRRCAQAAQIVDDILFELVAEKRASQNTGDDVLSRLIAAAADSEVGMSDRQLRDEAVTFFGAGHETTALATTYSYYLLSLHPEAQDRLLAEVDEVLKGRPAQADDAESLPWTRAVFLEAMRLYPPVWAMGRENIADVVIGGYPVPKGSQIYISQWVMHRDRRWFDDPESFRPERWMDGLQDRLPRFVYLPFGGGPRVCLGNHFAMLEAVMMLATIAQRWRVSATSTEPLPLQPSITLRPARTLSLRLHAV